MKYDIVGIGNAIIDISSFIDDKTLLEKQIDKGIMSLIDEEYSSKLWQQKTDNCCVCAGGSVANTIVTMANIGLGTSYFGKVGCDTKGKSFLDDLKKQNVDGFVGVCNNKKTATCNVYITEDGERTMLTYLGACVNFNEKDVKEDVIKNSKVLFLEGYLWDDENAKKAILKSCEVARENGVKIALSLSDPFCVDRHKDSFTKLIEDYIDIIICNEDEFSMMYGDNGAEFVNENFANKTFAVTLGENGAIALQNGNIVKCDGIEVEVVDTTGAGDAFAGGFLFGLIKDKTLEKSLQIGINIASNIIQIQGARLSKEKVIELSKIFD